MALAFVTPQYKWPIDTLRVVFLPEAADFQLLQARRTYLIAQVKKYAVAWEPFANIKFSFVDDGYAEIRVQFRLGGSASRIGNGGMSVVRDQEYHAFPNLYLKSSMDDATLSHTIIHEFGHALGADHEHQSPNGAAILWNKRMIIEHYRRDRGWTAGDANENIFHKYVVEHANSSVFDPLSIMMYDILPGWTKNGFVARRGRHLSAMDKSWVNRMYPQPVRGIGTYSTIENAAGATPNRITKDFSRVLPAAPNITLGLTSFDTTAGAPLIRPLANNFQTNTFMVDLNTHKNFTSAAVTWLETAFTDPSFKVGTVTHNGAAQRNIVYPIPFLEIAGVVEAPPIVVVWLQSFRLPAIAAFSIKVHASDQTARGFTLHIETSANCPADSVIVSWIAYPEGLPKTWSGYIETDPGEESGNGTVLFPTDKFANAPRVALAVNWLDIQAGESIRFSATTQNVTTLGMAWNLTSCVGASYLAHG